MHGAILEIAFFVCYKEHMFEKERILKAKKGLVCMKKLNPPIARLGGKSKLRNQIISMLPEHKCYCEPFFGAGWVYFGKEPSKVEVINDKDSNLVNLFRVLKFHPKEMERLLKYEVNARDTFEYYKGTEMETDIQKAVQFFYRINSSFASIGNCYGYRPSRPPKQILNMQFERIAERLGKTYIENLDFEEMIKKYDREYTVFFCDPPYLDVTGYEVKFEKDDHIRLHSVLDSIKGKFLLTINDHPLVQELYRSYNITETTTIYSANVAKNKRVKELIITNF